MTSREKVLVTVFVAFAGGIALIGGFLKLTDTSANPTAIVEPSKPAFDRSPAKQAQRQALVQKMVDQGYIRNIRISAQGTPVVTVSNGFLAGDFKDKQDLVSVIYALHFDGSKPTDQVRLVSAQTGKEIGFYMIKIGLQLQ